MTKSKKESELTFILSPKWTINRQEESLLISGGADARYAIEIENDEPSFFESLESNTPFNRSSLSIFDKKIFEQLLTAEIIIPSIEQKTKINVAINGDANNFNFINNKRINFVNQGEPYDYVLIIRTKSTYADLLNTINYKSINKPHLFVDAAFHHTISIGPLVFPGETACVACLEGRLSSRWGDDIPPSSAEIASENSDLVKGITMLELSKIAAKDTGLINKTISWNFQNRTVIKNQLLKVPLCPICSKNVIDLNGKLMLPWTKNESINDTI